MAEGREGTAGAVMVLENCVSLGKMSPMMPKADLATLRFGKYL